MCVSASASVSECDPCQCGYLLGECVCVFYDLPRGRCMTVAVVSLKPRLPLSDTPVITLGSGIQGTGSPFFCFVGWEGQSSFGCVNKE